MKGASSPGGVGLAHCPAECLHAAGDGLDGGQFAALDLGDPARGDAHGLGELDLGEAALLALRGEPRPVAWRDTGKLPATADDQPPGDDPGLVKVSVPEARRLLRLAITPMSRAARDLGYTWSRWRRRHQARARWHHYHAQLKAARVT
jgi:hypothetical protein